jgi:hypothetical protein
MAFLEPLIAKSKDEERDWGRKRRGMWDSGVLAHVLDKPTVCATRRYGTGPTDCNPPGPAAAKRSRNLPGFCLHFGPHLIPLGDWQPLLSAFLGTLRRSIEG